jgi:hypothetical protein
MSEAYAIILLITNERQQMRITHKVNIDVDLDDKTTPDHILSSLLRLTESQMQALLADAFIDSINATGAMDTINKGHSYAVVSFSKDQN